MPVNFSLLIKKSSQLPGEVNSMLGGMQVVSFHKASQTTHSVASYKVSVPTQLLLPTLGSTPASNSALFEFASSKSCTVKIPALVLEYMKPDLLWGQALSQLTAGTSSVNMEHEGRLGSASQPVIDLTIGTACGGCSGAIEEVIELMEED